MDDAYLHLTLVLTHACNLACGYCYTGEKSARAMPLETALAALAYAFARAARVDLAFFGGEPLLAYDSLTAIAGAARGMAGARGAALRMQVTTNGTLLTAGRARELAGLGVRTTLSLDGDRAAHEATRPRRGGGSSFDAVLCGAEALRAAGLSLEIVAVVAPENVARLGASAAFLAHLGADRIVLNWCYERPWSDDDLARLEVELHAVGALYEHRMRSGAPLAISVFDDKLACAVNGPAEPRRMCSLGRHDLAVAPSGNLYPCERLVAADDDPRFVLGNVLATGALAPPLVVTRDEACDGCAERWRCSSGCACANLAETGDPNRPGGAQCWIEQTAARIADAVGRRLLEERCPAFLAWAYGALASPTEARRTAQSARLHVMRGPS